MCRRSMDRTPLARLNPRPLTTISRDRFLVVALLVLIICQSSGSSGDGTLRFASASASASTSESVSTLSAPFRVSAMTYVDTQGAFLYSPNNLFTLTFVTQPVSGPDEDMVYVCVIHAPSQQIVWTANRDSPISTSDQLQLSVGGDLALVPSSNTSSTTYWSTNTAGLGAKWMTIQDSGNLVLLDESNTSVVWQSFDHPTDTLLCGQTFRGDMMLRSGTISNKNLSSGPYGLSVVDGDLKLLVLSLSSQSVPYWSMLSDPRHVQLGDGQASGVHALLAPGTLTLVKDEDGSTPVSSITWASNASMCRAHLKHDGTFQIEVQSSVNVWTTVFTSPQAVCQLPLHCGTNGICSSSGQCSCPDGFRQLDADDITHGCAGSTFHPSCANVSTSTSTRFDKVGDGLEYFSNRFEAPVKASSRGIDECKHLCSQNCSCSSFFFYNDSGSCFLVSHAELGTIQRTGILGRTLYMKIDSTISLSPGEAGLPSFVLPIIMASVISSIFIAACAFGFWYLKAKKKINLSNKRVFLDMFESDSNSFLVSIPGLPTRFSFKELYLATNGFDTKLGEGGFGSVYQGKMSDGTKVAVKQLECIGQGQKEFQAEISIIGQINHVHLVQLHGFCAEGIHRLLVYEFLPNGSLDKCLFIEDTDDVPRKPVLDWETRCRIALGTARGLAYLHDDCREKIIHCDIKPENILLDEDFNAKVSDFGLAKLVHKHEKSHVFTTMRGTRGYLAPEWVMNLAISEKSDVYSFGMVLLEILSGRRNFCRSGSEGMYFPLYAFEQEEKGELELLLDLKLRGSVPGDEIRRVVRIALWCIQEDVALRPSMARIVEMLERKMEIPEPPFSPLFAARMHAHLVEAMDSSHHGSNSSSSSVYFDKTYAQSTLLSSIQLSEAR